MLAAYLNCKLPGTLFDADTLKQKSHACLCFLALPNGCLRERLSATRSTISSINCAAQKSCLGIFPSYALLIIRTLRNRDLVRDFVPTAMRSAKLCYGRKSVNGAKSRHCSALELYRKNQPWIESLRDSQQGCHAQQLKRMGRRGCCPGNTGGG